MKPPLLVFCAVLAACAGATQSAEAPATHGCRDNETTCVDGNLKPTGYCCPETYACGGPFPNVGCAPGACCPTQSGGLEDRQSVKQRRAN